jgi:hypothetical protein
VNKEIAEAEGDLAGMKDGPTKNYASKYLDGLKYRKAVIAANLANPGNLSVTDIRMLQVAAKRLLRADKANVVTLAQFVLDNVEVFPVKGTRY